MKFSVTSQKDARKGLDAIVSQLNKSARFGLEDITHTEKLPTMVFTTGAATVNPNSYIIYDTFGPFCLCTTTILIAVTVNVATIQIDLNVAPNFTSGPTTKRSIPVPVQTLLVGGAVPVLPNPFCSLKLKTGTTSPILELIPPGGGFWTVGNNAVSAAFVYPVDPTI